MLETRIYLEFFLLLSSSTLGQLYKRLFLAKQVRGEHSFLTLLTHKLILMTPNTETLRHQSLPKLSGQMTLAQKEMEMLQSERNYFCLSFIKW